MTLNLRWFWICTAALSFGFCVLGSGKLPLGERRAALLGAGFWILWFGFGILGFAFWVVGSFPRQKESSPFGCWVLEFVFWDWDFGFWVLVKLEGAEGVRLALLEQYRPVSRQAPLHRGVWGVEKP